MFNHFPQSELTIVAPDGSVRSVEKGIVDSKQVAIPNKNAVILAGDEIRRKLPNGTEEVFEVIDPVYYDGMGGAIPPHYQVKIRRKGSFPAGTGGNFTFHVSGTNARVNISSHDNSQNIAANNSVFGDLKNALQKSVSDSDDRARLLSLVQKLEEKSSDPTAYASAYQSFIASAANYMTIIAPFLPALTKFIG